MYIITHKFTRPDDTVEFISMSHESTPPEVRAHWMNTYKSTGKCIFVDTQLSENKLERTVTMMWDSKNSLIEYQNDPVIVEGLHQHMRKQREENGFTKEIISEEEI